MFRLVCLLVLSLNGAFAYQCEEETIFGQTRYISCPQSYDPPENIYCCGTDEHRRCCASLLEDFDFDVDPDSIVKLVTGVIVAIFVCIVLAIVCCCCCPFCFLYKRRNRGAIHNPSPSVTQMQPTANPGQTGYTQVQQQMAPYPAQPYPNQPYPTQTQPQPGYGMPPQPGFGVPPPGGAPPVNPPYPVMPAEQPPPYTEKQPAYNPNY